MKLMCIANNIHIYIYSLTINEDHKKIGDFNKSLIYVRYR